MAKPTNARKWVRVILRGPAEGELLLRADRTAVEDGHVLFFVGDEPTFRIEYRYFRSMAWFADRPTFADWLRERRAERPNHGRPWTAEEDAQLRDEIADGLSLARIADRHGRRPSALRTRMELLARAGTSP